MFGRAWSVVPTVKPGCKANSLLTKSAAGNFSGFTERLGAAQRCAAGHRHLLHQLDDGMPHTTWRCAWDPGRPPGETDCRGGTSVRRTIYDRGDSPAFRSYNWTSASPWMGIDLSVWPIESPAMPENNLRATASFANLAENAGSSGLVPSD